MNTKKAVAAVVLVSLLALGLSAASAQGQRGGQPRPGDGLGGVLALVVEQTGLDAAEIMQQLNDGSTLAQVIEANGGDVQAVIAAAVDAAAERVNQAVETGRITAEVAAARLALIEAQVTDAVNGAFDPLLGGLRDRFQDRMERGRGMQDWGVRGQMMGVHADIIALAAEQTGLDASSILGQLADGETLGDILRANDVDMNAFVDAAVAQAEAHMTEQSQARLDALRARLLSLLGEAENL
jgi:hypothetical protein